MRRFFALLALLAVVAAAFSSETSYTISMDGPDAMVTGQLELSSDKKVNYFQASVLLPENADVLSLADGQGKIEGFSMYSGKLDFQTNYSIAKDREQVEIGMKIPGARQDNLAPLYYSEFSLPAFEGSNTSVEISAPEILAFETSGGFVSGLREGKLFLKGSGPVSVRLYYSTKGTRTQKYVFFNLTGKSDDYLIEKGFDDADRLYWIIEQITGIRHQFPKTLVAVLSDRDYNSIVNNYSEGVYRTGGIIFIREQVFRENAAPVIIHESTHAVNAQVFLWNNSQAAWLDEGAAKLAEYFAKKMLGMRSPNLFYGNISYVEGNYKYTLYPNSSLPELSDYYGSGKTFMEAWNPSTGSMREFGYAFSELFFRNYVMDNSFQKLREKYREFLAVKGEITDDAEFTGKIMGIFGTELSPCRAESSDLIKSCVERANNFNPMPENEFEVLLLGIGNTETGGTAEIPKPGIKEEKMLEIKNAFSAYNDAVLRFLQEAFIFISEKALLLAAVEK